MQPTSETGKKAWILGLASAAPFMVALDALVVSTALSTIRISLGASFEAWQWTANAYNLRFAMLRMTGAEPRRCCARTLCRRRSCRACCHSRLCSLGEHAHADQHDAARALDQAEVSAEPADPAQGVVGRQPARRNGTPRPKP
jgi:hypothetical protein